MNALAQDLRLDLPLRPTRLWRPELSERLVAVEPKSMAERSQRQYANASTSELLTGGLEKPRALLTLSSSPNVSGNQIKVEVLASGAQALLRERGVVFAKQSELRTGGGRTDTLIEALNLVEVLPGLLRTVSTVVRRLHVLNARDDAFDVSFSDPGLPSCIFVSIPRTRNLEAALRLAEAIIHEAMHLQLTLIERVVPLVLPGEIQFYSPWRRAMRQASGVLHAIFVFAVIDQWLAQVMHVGTTYATRRRRDIADEIDQVRSFKSCQALTTEGMALSAALLPES